MDMNQAKAGAGHRSRNGAWQFPAFLVVGAAVLGACSSTKDVTGPPLGTAAGLAILVQPPATIASRAPLTPVPVIQVVDRAGTPVDTAGIPVLIALTTSAGAIGGVTTVNTDLNGQASFAGLNVHGTVGTKALRFSSGTLSGIQSNSFALTAGPASDLVANSPVSQSGITGQSVVTLPSVKVVDLDANPVSGVAVTFAVASGGGSVTGGSTTSNASGVATVGDWTLGAAAGANTLTATSTGLAGSPLTFTATGGSTISNYTITVQFLANPTAPTPSQIAAFNAAASRWQQVITGDIGPFTFPSGFVTDTACTPGRNIPVSGTINDLLILVDLKPYDGVGNVLGAASPCYIRTTGNKLPIIGYMFFDTADLANIEAAGQLSDVILHEMGHVLGFGTLWTNPPHALVSGACTSASAFTGAAALTAYVGSNGGTGTTVPLENVGTCTNGQGDGTRDAHWRETIFRSELMTGYISGIFRPLSLTSIESMADLGYTVNAAQADPFNLATQPTLRLPDPNAIYLHNDVLHIPIYSVNEQTGQLTPAPRQ